MQSRRLVRVPAGLYLVLPLEVVHFHLAHRAKVLLTFVAVERRIALHARHPRAATALDHLLAPRAKRVLAGFTEVDLLTGLAVGLGALPTNVDVNRAVDTTGTEV